MLHAGSCGLDSIIKIVHHEEIEQPIVVVVEPPCSHRPSLAEFWNHPSNSCLLGHVGECTVSIVMEKLVAVDSGHVKIDESIIVVVAGGHSHRIPDPLQARFLGYIGEGAVPIVAEEAVPVTGVGLFQRRDGRAIGEEDVEQAVVVVVEDTDSTRHGLKRVPLRTDAVLEFEFDFGLFDYIFELDRRGSWHYCLRRLFAGGSAWRCLSEQTGNATQQKKHNLSDKVPVGAFLGVGHASRLFTAL